MREPGLISTTAIASVERAINAALRSDPATAARRSRHAGRLLAVHLTLPPLRLYALIVEEGVRPWGNPMGAAQFGSTFFMITGFHGLHVTGGLIAFLLVIGRAYAVKTFTHRDATSAIVVSYYWHFVDVVWIGLFLVIYVLR